MLGILSYGFMQRAFLAGIIIAVICPAIGIFLVLRRMSMIGDTLSHVALAGVAGGMLGGIYPVYSALGFSVLSALAIEKLSKEYEQYKELSVAIILSAGIGLATIFIFLLYLSNMTPLCRPSQQSISMAIFPCGWASIREPKTTSSNIRWARRS